MDSSDAAEVFSSACKAFREGLSEEDLKDFIEYQDSSAMIQDIVNRCKEHPIHEARLTRCCQRIDLLASNLAPFFNIINIFVQAGPQFAGFAWGALRLVFQVRKNITSIRSTYGLTNQTTHIARYSLYDIPRKAD